MDELHDMTTRLEGALARLDAPWLRRVVVVRETSSTQDFAREMAGGRGGFLVVAGRQLAGRGRLGRRWADTSQRGLAMTFVLDPPNTCPERLAIASGLAACRALDGLLGDLGRVGLRWPNDVVQRELGGAPGRKLAGVLIERDGPLALIGVGINVLQEQGDWPQELARRVTSLRELGAGCDRAAVAERVIKELDRALGLDDAGLADAWTRHDVLVGRTGAFFHNGVVYRGKIQAIEPTSHVRLLTDGGEIRLPALTTSMLHEQ
jgi:BirA family transcriptional regulator, biotin operon repressor / biotin---[acetyl-CoA-carboxylase] ligase